MKMAEFLALSDDDKVEAMSNSESYDEVTEDKGHCVGCGSEVNVAYFCFGCHQLVCGNCTESSKHPCNN